MKQSDWLKSLSERAGFFSSGPLWNATARCEMELHGLVFAGEKRSETIFRRKKLPKTFEKHSLTIVRYENELNKAIKTSY
jgi:hypothetical protein